MSCRSSDGGLIRAYETLDRGARFLPSWVRPADPSALGHIPATHAHRSKVIANGLRELDRFLNLLIDEVAVLNGLFVDPRRHNTANKLRDLRQALGLPDSDRTRLLALGRSRDCLFHCGGVARRSDAFETRVMTLGWPSAQGTALHQIETGQRIAVERADLESVGQLYQKIACELLHHHR